MLVQGLKTIKLYRKKADKLFASSDAVKAVSKLAVFLKSKSTFSCPAGRLPLPVTQDCTWEAHPPSRIVPAVCTDVEMAGSDLPNAGSHEILFSHHFLFPNAFILQKHKVILPFYPFTKSCSSSALREARRRWLMFQTQMLLNYMGHSLCSTTGPQTCRASDAIRCRHTDRLRGTKAGVVPSFRGVREAFTGQRHWIALRWLGAFKTGRLRQGHSGQSLEEHGKGRWRGRRASYGVVFDTYRSLDFMPQVVENQCRALSCGRIESGFRF